MSRIGKQTIQIPKEVKVEVNTGSISVKASKGSLDFAFDKLIEVKAKDGVIEVKRKNNSKPARCLHGTTRAIIANMIKGVSEGFKKELEIIGVGYKAQMKGKSLNLNIGFSHPVEVPIPGELKVNVASNTRIVVEGIDKQKVGEFAARIRMIYPPEPYKGKGIRYTGEEVRKKLGKALAK